MITSTFYVLLGFVAAWFIQEFRLYLTKLQFKNLYEKYDSWRIDVWAKLTYPERDIIKDSGMILKEEGEKKVLDDITDNFKKILYPDGPSFH